MNSREKSKIGWKHRLIISLWLDTMSAREVQKMLCIKNSFVHVTARSNFFLPSKLKYFYFPLFISIGLFVFKVYFFILCRIPYINNCPHNGPMDMPLGKGFFFLIQIIKLCMTDKIRKLTSILFYERFFSDTIPLYI